MIRLRSGRTKGKTGVERKNGLRLVIYQKALFYWGKWWTWPGSNRRPPACKAGALPAELHARTRSHPHSKAFAAVPHAHPSQNCHNCARTVPNKLQLTLCACATVPDTVPNGVFSSFACRSSFWRASLFICNFTCESFLKT